MSDVKPGIVEMIQEERRVSRNKYFFGGVNEACSTKDSSKNGKYRKLFCFHFELLLKLPHYLTMFWLFDFKIGPIN
jgi:hypothetical protein